MKALFVPSLFFLVLASHVANARDTATPDYTDIDVVSVAPRSPDVKPIMLVVFPEADKNKTPAKKPVVKQPVRESDQ